MLMYYDSFLSEHFSTIDDATDFVVQKCNDLFTHDPKLASEYFYKLGDMLFFRQIGDKSGEFLSDIIIPLLQTTTTTEQTETPDNSHTPGKVVTVSKTIQEWVEDYKDLFTKASKNSKKPTVQMYRQDRMELVLSLIPKLSSDASVFEYSTQERDGETLHTISYLGSDESVIPQVVRKRYATLLNAYGAIYAYYGADNISNRQFEQLADKIKSVCKKLESDGGATDYYFYKSQMGFYYINYAHLQEFMYDFVLKDSDGNNSKKPRKIQDPNLISMDNAATKIIDRLPYLSIGLNKNETFCREHVWQYIHDAEILLSDFNRDDFVIKDDQTTLFKQDKLNDFIDIIKQVRKKKADTAREQIEREEERRKEEEKRRKEEEKQNKIALGELKQRIMAELGITSNEYDKIYAKRNTEDDKRWFTQRSGMYRRLHKSSFDDYKNWFISELSKREKPSEAKSPENTVQKAKNNLELDIRKTNLLKRTKNCLLGANIDTVGKLVKTTKEELYQIRGFGRRSMADIEWTLEQMGLELASSIPAQPKPDLSKIRIENLRSLKGAQNPLLAAGIDTVDKLIKMTEQDLLKIHGLGRIAIQHIDATLEQMGLELSKATPVKKKQQGNKTTQVNKITPVVVIPDEPKTLLDLKALETTATAIIKLIEIASQYEAKSAELATANKELEAAQEEMYGETDTQKIRSITGKILDAAQTRDQKEIEVATSAKAKELLEQKQSAQADKDNAEQALSDANKKLDDVFLNIATFLESLKQNSR